MIGKCGNEQAWSPSLGQKFWGIICEKHECVILSLLNAKNPSGILLLLIDHCRGEQGMRQLF